MKTLDGKVVAITGAGSGIGRALAVACGKLGAKLALSDVDGAGLEGTLAQARESGARVHAERVDVADRGAIYAWADHVKAEYGGAEVVINNAGVSLSDTIESMTDEDFKWLFDINFWGVAHGCRAFLPQLRSRPEGHVVNISSVFGIIAVPTQAAYNAAKFAVRGYTEALRQELRGTTVHVTCVHPGGIQTNIVRKGRHYRDATGQRTDTKTAADEFAAVALTTADEAASAIVRAILKDRPRLLIGADARVIDLVARLFPAHYDGFVSAAGKFQARKKK
jgi:NAD(P)-dependent dehydrogenase (short-subunit alcohol dehydrogenase family)